MTREVAPMIAAQSCAPRRRTRMIRRARGTAMVELVLLSAVWLSACAPLIPFARTVTVGARAITVGGCVHHPAGRHADRPIFHPSRPRSTRRARKG
jgi:hypothetical protein